MVIVARETDTSFPCHDTVPQKSGKRERERNPQKLDSDCCEENTQQMQLEQ